METKISPEIADSDDLPTIVAARPDAAAPGSGVYAPGDVIFNNFRIERAIAEGGMGRVYQATHLVTSATVALKVVRGEYARDPALRELFRREAAALRRIGNPAVVRYEGAFEDPHGQLALVMEFIEGVSLARRLLDGPRLTVDEVRRLRTRLAGGLAAAHAERIVHRDLSPDNVILPGGRIDDAKIIDFGIARQSVENGATLIGAGFAGKLGYAAPEQLGLRGGEVDGRADVYALGLVLAAAATGAPLDMGGTLGAAIKARADLPDLTAVPAPLRRELAWMLQPDPDQRAPSMDALLVDTAPRRFLPRPRSRLARAAVMAVAFAGATMAGAVGWIVAEHELGLDVAHAETRAPSTIGADIDRLVA
ncbi:MAG: serine/threonine protein kinase, partial [Rhodospirillales bacterium]|nr:serine/threonine protein kinase [Rhodospirillales bacterium]